MEKIRVTFVALALLVFAPVPPGPNKAQAAAIETPAFLLNFSSLQRFSQTLRSGFKTAMPYVALPRETSNQKEFSRERPKHFESLETRITNEWALHRLLLSQS